MTNQPTTPANPAPAANAAPANQPPKKEASPFKDTLNFPKTSFAMKAELVKNEPASIKRWASMNLYQKARDAAAGKPKFAFHDGPPYANGSIHLGHLMNKVLKDMVVRSRTMAGFDCAYVPGWDCHGLPIEHKVMTEMVEKGKYEKLKTLEEGTRRMAIRRECKACAEKFHKLHTQQFQRLMTLADYEHPYLTMQPEYEGATLEVLANLLSKGLVYRALKPVHWSIANETALAEAELEYEDREDLSVYVDFEAESAGAVYDAFGLPAGSESEDDGAEDAGNGESGNAPKPGTRPGQSPCFMIWTTTPWTLPANLAIAVNPAFEYGLYWVDGNVTVLATALAEKVFKIAKVERFMQLAAVQGEKLLGLKYRHPFVPAETHAGASVFRVVGAEYVTLEDGTGLVHTAPGHGVDDYKTGQREGLPIYCPVRGDGTYDGTAPEFIRGKDVWTANGLVAEHLRASGHLFFDHKFTHSYPHDWRAKKPTIFRCTDQWFVSVDKAGGPSLREMALNATSESGGGEKIRFVPEWGRNRMRGMLESRPDWCISRQRAWGLPIPAFVYTDGEGNEKTFMTPATVTAVAKLVREKGSDVWFTSGPGDLLAHYTLATDPDAPAFLKTNAAAFGALKKGGDILDVWFESGSSWNSVMRERNLGYPADLYLEGSDQHRGWFQLSLLPALGVTGVPPFKTLLTHGFMVDKDGRKLSKSMGDSVEELFTKFGVDVLRWWVSSLACDNDVKVDESYFALAGESYRKVRNTLRFVISNLYDFAPGTDAPAPAPTSLDAWVLGELDQLSREVTGAYEQFQFKTAQARIYDFCNDTLSAIYLAAVKDRLYCDKADSARRRMTQGTLWKLADGLCGLLAPIMVHTADEAYRSLVGADKPGATNAEACVHLREFPALSGVMASAEWAKVFALREAVSAALERAKDQLGERVVKIEKDGTERAGILFEAVDFGITLPDPTNVLQAFDPVDLADLLGVSQVFLDAAATAPSVVDLRGQPKCERSWKRDGTVKPRGENKVMLSDRDAAAMGLA